MKRKIVTLVCGALTVVMMGSLLSGCGKKTEEVATQSTQAVTATATQMEESKKEITIIGAAKQDWIKDIDKTLAETMKAETGITVEFQVTPNDQYDNVIKTKLAAGEGPDFFYGDSGLQIYKYAPETNCADLSNEPWVSRYTAGAKDATSFNGKVYGLNTWASDVWAMMYDSKLFDKLGLKAPTTWDEFLAVCETLKNNGVTPLYENGKDTWHWPGFFTNSGAAVEKSNPGAFAKINSGEKKFSDYPEFEKAMANLKLLYDKGYFSKDVISETWGKQEEAMASGKYGMFLVWSSFCNEIVAKFPDAGPVDRWKMFNNPLYGDLTICETSIGGITRYANASSENLDSVKVYFNWLAKSENLVKFYEASPNLAAIKPFTDVNLPTNPALESYLAIGNNVILDDVQAKINYINGDLIAKGIQDMLYGAKTPKQLVESIDADREKTLKTIQN